MHLTNSFHITTIGDQFLYSTEGCNIPYWPRWLNMIPSIFVRFHEKAINTVLAVKITNAYLEQLQWWSEGSEKPFWKRAGADRSYGGYTKLTN